MGDLTTAMARAADTLSESLAAPRTTGSQTRYGTVVANNGSTLDVAMAGGTIAGVPMTTACCSAVAGDRVLLDVTGPLVTATGILANSDNGPYVKRSGVRWYTAVHSGTSVVVSKSVSETCKWFGVTEDYAKEHLAGVFWNGDPLAVPDKVVTGYVDDGNICGRSSYSGLWRITGLVFLV